MSKLTLIRGLPGSGKSTLAKAMANSIANTVHIEADMYFIRNGAYKYNKAEIQDAHHWCMTTARCLLNAGYNVVVANTFVQMWQIKPYLKLVGDGENVDIIVCKGNHGSVHDVPEESMQNFRNKWEEFGDEALS